MLKLTKTGIGLLTRQYRSVLKKCWLINIGIFAATTVLTTMAPKNVNSAVWVAFNNLGEFTGLYEDYYTATNNSNTYNVYGLYSIGEVENGYATLSGDNIFRGVQYYYDTNGNQKALLTGRDGYGELWLSDSDGNLDATYMNGTSFRLASSGYATGIDFASNVTAGTTYESHLATTGSVSQMLSNNYYTKV